MPREPQLEEGELPELGALQGGQVLIGSREQPLEMIAAKQPALPGSRGVEALADQGQGVALERRQGGDREVALGAIDHRIGDEPASRGLEHALATLGEFELGRAGGRELDELVIKEGSSGLEAPGHGHVVDALDGIVDEHDLRIEPERAVDRAVSYTHLTLPTK